MRTHTQALDGLADSASGEKRLGQCRSGPNPYRSRDDRPGVVLVRFSEGEAAHVDWVALEPIDPTGPTDPAAVTR